VQEELEKLNSCTDEINRLEVQLDEANLVFRRLLSDSTHHLKARGCPRNYPWTGFGLFEKL
jgi:hypothetical protein